MALTNSGAQYLARAVIDDNPVFFNEANAHIGVGDGSGSFVASQTDLLGANKTRKKVSEEPVRSDRELIFKTVFNPDEANHAWSEWGIFNASTGGTMLNRTTESLGAKSGGTWALTVQIQVNPG